LWYGWNVTRWLLTLTLGLAAACGSGAPAQAVVAGPEAMTTPYLTIQETLARDSIDGLSQLSARVVTAAEPAQTAGGVAELIAGAGRVAVPDIDTARLAFSKMSMGLITYLKQHPGERADLEVVHCPMAFNNKGAFWVQRTGEINNPYHGMMMLHCGDKVAWDKAPG
jgi:Cu(I)/Ag(I) efflux system membrane fusion protein